MPGCEFDSFLLLVVVRYRTTPPPCYEGLVFLQSNSYMNFRVIIRADLWKVHNVSPVVAEWHFKCLFGDSRDEALFNITPRCGSLHRGQRVNVQVRRRPGGPGLGWYISPSHFTPIPWCIRKYYGCKRRGVASSDKNALRERNVHEIALYNY